ncbi:zinc finger protein 768-like [Physella acuta]|uniref:zinc finger protein 768-like n=1 Tax=Physella acuta TaxID=109671 RepID=UPI0027DDC3DE|nr:zinc finger protein 768-like [Physella acuta]
MFNLRLNAIFSCLFGLVTAHADYFLRSPDVDTQAGFFPDSGFLGSNQQWETHSTGLVYNTPSHHHSTYNGPPVHNPNYNSQPGHSPGYNNHPGYNGQVPGYSSQISGYNPHNTGYISQTSLFEDPTPSYSSYNVNRQIPVVETADGISKRLQRLMAALSHRKTHTANKSLPAATHVEDPAFLHMFTGAKDNKG